MWKIMRYQLTPEQFDNVLSWGIGILMLVVCTVLVFLTAAEVTLLTELILIASLVVGWFVLGLLCPRSRKNGTK